MVAFLHHRGHREHREQKRTQRRKDAKVFSLRLGVLALRHLILSNSLFSVPSVSSVVIFL